MAQAGGAIWAVVLAAGRGRRMAASAGQTGEGETPKQLLCIAGEPMVRRVVRTALEAGVDGAAVVVGAAAGAVAEALHGLDVDRVRIVYNPDHERGMSTSLLLGVASLPAEVSGALVLLADQPAVTAGLLRDVIDAGRGGPASACRYPTGGLGPPCLFHRSTWPELASLRGDRGARSVLTRLGSLARVVEAPAGLLVDVDTVGDLARLPQAGV